MDWFYRHKKRIIVATLVLLLAVIGAAMIGIGGLLKVRLISESKAMTGELAAVIEHSLNRLMIVRNREDIQATLEIISRGGSSVTKAFILDRHGTVAYSSDRDDIGVTHDRDRDPSCTGCHARATAAGGRSTMILEEHGRKVLRSVNVIRNDRACHGCHLPSNATIGKLIIDRSLQPTFGLITMVQMVLAGAGGISILVLGPFLFRILSRGIDRYIAEILFKSRELTVLYMIVERLSKTIELDELKAVIIDMLRELFHAGEITIILPRAAGEYSGTAWSEGGRTAERRVPPDGDPHRELIDAWLRGEIDRETIIEEGRTVYLPVAKGATRFGLIIMQRNDRSFEERDLELVRAMRSHMAVAFDNAALYHIATTDELTGLYTKRHFRTMIEKKYRLYEQYGEKMTLLMLDIDDFKKVNDTHGHPAGDAVLRSAAQVVLNTIRQGDMAFRYGGEEFAVLLPATESAGARTVAERIREQVAASAVVIGEAAITVTVSIGSAAIPEHAGTIRDLVSEADNALYSAKKSGKNRVVVSGIRS